MIKKILLLFSFYILLINNVYSQENLTDNWKFNGEVLLRGESDGRDFNNSTPLNFYTIMRTRFSMEKLLLEGTEFYLQIEDSRIFGEEGSSVANLRNIDMFQGYLNFIKPFKMPFDIQIGRFIMDYGTTRFFSSLPGWNYIGRSFDGIRVKNKNDYFNLDIFSLITNTSSRYISNASPDLYSVINPNINNTITGLWLNKDIGFNEINFF